VLVLGRKMGFYCPKYGIPKMVSGRIKENMGGRIPPMFDY
jgi:hypothetical protein